MEQTTVDKRIPWLRRLRTGLAHVVVNTGANLPSQHLRKLALRMLGMRLGAESVIYWGAEVRAPWRISIGNYSSIGTRAILDGRGGLVIKDCVNLSSEVMLWTNQHDYRRKDFPIVGGTIVIEDYAWLGPRVIVLPGVTIGRGCVIAAAAVVTRDAEPFGVYAGVPARRIGERAEDVDYKPGRNYIPII
jgi:acetyltransferase-like isoleucine patch superfamily enzyme